MKKKEYIIPTIMVVTLSRQHQLLAGSGPEPGSQNNPNVGAPGYDGPEDYEFDEE